MASYGLKSSGLVRPTLSEWTDDYITALNSAFGKNLNTSEDSRLGTIIRNFAYQDTQLWSLAEAVYSSRTINGAEGIYLDDVLNLRGVYRNPASAGTGVAVVATNSTASWVDTIPITTAFTATNGYSYYPTTEQNLYTKLYGYTVTKPQLVSIGSTATIYIRNTDTSVVTSTTVTTSSTTAIDTIIGFIRDNCSQADVDLVFNSSESGTSTAYVGFNPLDYTEFVGLSTPIEFYISGNCGVKYSGIDVMCSSAGFYTVAVGNISTMSPTPNGYVSVTNTEEFYGGSDVETDSDFITRFNSVVDEATASTKPSLIAALLDIDGVTNVQIYDNPTTVDDPTNNTKAYTFQCVVGGEATAEEVGTVLANKKPINAGTSGTNYYTYVYEDGISEDIYYTPVVEEAYTVKVEYKTRDGYALAAGHRTSIQAAMVELSKDFEIGGTVFNSQLQAVVYNNVEYGKLTDLVVRTKKYISDDIEYTTSNVYVGYSTLPTISTSNILFQQVT